MKAEDYHRSMKPLEAACARAHDWVCLPLPLTGGKLMILLRHVLLVFKIFRIRHRRILLREFSTLPLLLVFPLLWPFRKRMWFLIHHNLQWAVRDPLERFGLTMLAKMGARWALLETQDFQGLEQFKIPADQNLVLPHPVSNHWKKMMASPGEALKSGAAGSKGWKNGDQPVVGVAGYYRPEKGMDELVKLLKKINGCRDFRLPEFGILLGVPNPEAAAHLGVETVATASEEDYYRMIARCDVLVFNYQADSYLYRASGPITDAAAVGTAVVAPDFSPDHRERGRTNERQGAKRVAIIGKQVAGIGEVFHSTTGKEAGAKQQQRNGVERPTLEKLPVALLRALEAVDAGRYDFEAYCKARSVEELANCLDCMAEKTFQPPAAPAFDEASVRHARGLERNSGVERFVHR